MLKRKMALMEKMGMISDDESKGSDKRSRAAKG
jgi:hypothetical protein